MVKAPGLMALVLACALLFGLWPGGAAWAQKPGVERGWKLAGHSYVPVLKLDGRYTFVNGCFAQLGGVKTGFEVDGRHEFGVGISATRKPISHDYYFSDPENPGVRPTTSQTMFRYADIYYEYNLLNTRTWALAGHYTQGMGMVSYRLYSKENSQYIREVNRGLLVFEPGFTLERVLARYVGAAVVGGYRFMVTDRQYGQPNLSGPFAALRARFYIGEVMYDARNWYRRKRAQKGAVAE